MQLFCKYIGDAVMRCDFGARTHDRASLLLTCDFRLATLVVEAMQ